MSLEQDTHELGSCNLKVVLIVVLLLDEGKVISIELIILIFDLVSRKLVVLLNSLERLVDNADRLFTEVVDLFRAHETWASSINDILEALHLGDECISVKLGLHGLVNVLIEGLGHGMKLSLISIALLGG